MWTSLATGTVALLVVLLGWVTVQLGWRRVFPDGDDPDALAGRMGCHGSCGPNDCARRCPGRERVAEEDRR